MSWEAYATKLANAETNEELAQEYQNLVSTLNISPNPKSAVVVARDTRASGPGLVEALSAALAAVNVKLIDEGLMTTPQLHYVVRCINTNGAYGQPSAAGYYEKFSEAFKRAMGDKKANGRVVVDCANGVGAPKMKELVPYIPSDLLTIEIANDNTEDATKLNLNVRPSLPSVHAERAPPYLSSAPAANPTFFTERCRLCQDQAHLPDRS